MEYNSRSNYRPLPANCQLMKALLKSKLLSGTVLALGGQAAFLIE